jgi:DNA adenine methylase
MKPLLKWVGGKTQLINHIRNRIPEKINNYHEIFLGGGSVLLEMLSLQKQGKISIKGKIYASDKNEDLIVFYKTLQTNPQEFYEKLENFFDTYNKTTGTTINRKPSNDEESRTSKESYYYWIRSQYNSGTFNDITKSAMFLFLNKTCFRGIHREGPNGFNVPFGNYKTAPNITSDDIKEFSTLIHPVVFTHCDFSESMRKVKVDDFVYLDPPYVPETKKSFVGYNGDGFTQHEQLFDTMDNVRKKRGVKLVMSNAKVDMVVERFQEWNIDEVKARRAIHSKNPSASTTEVLVFN